MRHNRNVKIDGIIPSNDRGSTSTIINRSEISDITSVIGRVSLVVPAICYGRNRHALRASCRVACHEEEKLLLTTSSWVDTFSPENRRHWIARGYSLRVITALCGPGLNNAAGVRRRFSDSGCSRRSFLAVLSPCPLRLHSSRLSDPLSNRNTWCSSHERWCSGQQ